MEENKRINYTLRDYQKSATDNISEIFNSEEHNRFAGVVLPTGGGKSFVAIEEILSINNPDYMSKNRTGEINSTSIIYIAPNTEILSQIKLHIVKNVILSIPNLENMTVQEIDSMMREDFPELNFNGIKGVSDNSSASEKKNAILREISTKQIDAMVHNAFPGLKFKCYAGVKENGKTEEIDEELDSLSSEEGLIILDEAHRVGAETWSVNTENLIKKHINKKVLAITATPERTDSKGENMMEGIAKIVYPGETVVPDTYMAKEIFVLDAMKDGIVTVPDGIQFNSSLANSKEYQEILEAYRKARGHEKEELGHILDEMEKIIGFSSREGKKEEKVAEDIKQTIKTNLKNPNGKYIAFVPSNRAEEGQEKVPTKEFFEEWMAKIKDYFSEVKDENGNPVKVEIEYLTSDSKVHNDDENSKALKDFEDSSNVSGGIKVLVAINKLNEGVHVDGIDGAFMFRGIGQDSSTLFLQQSGRCISSMDPSKPFEKQSKTQIFDVSGNFLKQINNNTGKKVSRRYDLEKIQEISEWMNEQGRIPDANSEDLKEARYAIALRRLRDKYSTYLQSNLPSKDRDKIKEIMGIGTEINLWEMIIPERTTYPNEEELTGARFLSMTDSQAKFMKLYNEARSLAKQREEAASIRVTKLINILTILKNHNPDLELPTGMMIEKESTQDCVNITLEEFLGNHFEQAEIEQILVELSDFDRLNATNKREIYHPGEVYNLGQELAFVRGKLWTSQQEYEKTGNNIFERYSAEELTRLDVIDSRHIKALEQELKELFGMDSRDLHTSEGFVKCKEKSFKCSGQEYGPVEEVAGHSILTGCVFIDGRDADGYDEQGYDELGFDRDGFDENGIHKITGESYDNRFFRKVETVDEQTGQKTFKWINMKTNSEYDLLGFNHEGFDKDGFERPAGLAQDDRGNIRYQARLWHKKREDGSYEKFGRRVNEKTGLDAHDFRYENGAVCGYYGRVGKQSTHNRFWSNGATQQHPDGKQDFYSYDGLDIDGFNKEGFKQITTPDGKTKYVHRNTSAEFDEYGKVYKSVLNKKTGKYEMKVADHSSIVKTKGVLYLLTAKNMTVAQVYKQYAKECKCSLEEAEAQIRKALETSMRISTIATHAFDDYAQSFKNLNNSPEKAKQIRQFFAICPEAKQRIIQESRETQRRLEKLDLEQKAIQQQSFEALRDGNSQEFARLSAKFKEKENANKTEKERLTKKAEILKHLDDFDGR